jgi:hypothetical protein
VSDEPIEQPAEPTERIVIVPRGRSIWLAPMPQRPEPVEDQEQEAPTDE